MDIARFEGLQAKLLLMQAQFVTTWLVFRLTFSMLVFYCLFKSAELSEESSSGKQTNRVNETVKDSKESCFRVEVDLAFMFLWMCFKQNKLFENQRESFNKNLIPFFKVKVSDGNIIKVFVYYPTVFVAMLSFPAALEVLPVVLRGRSRLRLRPDVLYELPDVMIGFNESHQHLWLPVSDICSKSGDTQRHLYRLLNITK